MNKDDEDSIRCPNCDENSLAPVENTDAGTVYWCDECGYEETR